jgi:hypothetical protein
LIFFNFEKSLREKNVWVLKGGVKCRKIYKVAATCVDEKGPVGGRYIRKKKGNENMAEYIRKESQVPMILTPSDATCLSWSLMITTLKELYIYKMYIYITPNQHRPTAPPT